MFDGVFEVLGYATLGLKVIGMVKRKFFGL